MEVYKDTYYKNLRTISFYHSNCRSEPSDWPRVDLRKYLLTESYQSVPQWPYSLVWKENKPVHYGKESQGAVKAHARKRIDK